MPATILITNNDRPVPEAPGRWKDGQILLVTDVPYTQGGEADITKFVQFTILDKTPTEVDQKFFAPYVRDVEMNVIAGPDPQGFRRINCRNLNTNASGTKGAWQVSGTDEIIAEWNAKYPTCNLTTVQIFGSINPNDTWQCEGTFTTGQAAEFSELLISTGLSILDYRRIWHVNSTGMANINANGGIQQGTASQLSNWVEDYRVTT